MDTVANAWRQRPVQRRLKRAGDILVAGVMLLLASPVMLVTALVVRCTMGKPVLFRQERPGFGGRPFLLRKFRTMREMANAAGTAAFDAQRLTPVGRFIRKLSLDELPQLFNVLRGDMSLVGPRPLLMQYLPLYSPRQKRRHDVPPGITGWAQVNGRNAIDWEQKFELDVWYVENWSVWLDVRILWKTLWNALRGKGVSAADHATMPAFRGSAPDQAGQKGDDGNSAGASSPE